MFCNLIYYRMDLFLSMYIMDSFVALQDLSFRPCGFLFIGIATLLYVCIYYSVFQCSTCEIQIQNIDN
jgi:hypothetical protein